MHNVNNFHFLRFFAALLVLFGHSYPLSGRGNLDYLQALTAGLFPTAHMGVCIFFSISGYLISNSLTNSTFVNFAWKRFLRIMPGLLVAVLITLFIIGPLATTLSLSEYFASPGTYAYLSLLKLFPANTNELPGVFKTLPLTNVNGSLWTLAYEVTCYLALLAAYIVFRKSLRYLLVVFFILIWGSFFYWHDQLIEKPILVRFIHLNLFDLLNFGLYFLVGSLLFFYQEYIRYSWVWLLILFTLFMGSYVLSSRMGLTSLSSIVWIRYLFIPYAILYFSFLKGPLDQFGKAGDFSYGLYIYAYPVQQLVVNFHSGKIISVPAMFILSFLLTLPLAWLSWKIVEEPMLRFKNVVK